MGRRTSTLGCRRAAAAGVGPPASPSGCGVELRTDQLLGLPGDAVLESAVQPVRIRLLRSLDPAVKFTSPDARFADRQSGRSPAPVGVTVCPQLGAASAPGRRSQRNYRKTALTWPNGDVAVDAYCARRDHWSGARRRCPRRPRIDRGQQPIGYAFRDHGERAGSAATSTEPWSRYSGTDKPGTDPDRTPAASSSHRQRSKSALINGLRPTRMAFLGFAGNLLGSNGIGLPARVPKFMLRAIR